MGKEINSVAKVVEVVYMAVNAFSENNVETDQVLDYLKDVIEKGLMNKSKSFSTLTSEDQEKMLPNGFAGEVCFDTTRLPNKFPSEFFTSLSVLRMTLSRELEAGCRPIIAHFLANAVLKARELFHQQRLAVHLEVPIPAIQIPSVGLVGGKLDFLLAEVAGSANMDLIMDVNDGLLAKVDVSKPVFIVVEAKRTAKLPDSSSVAELMGQLTSQLIRSGTTTHLGALTDGRKWQFYLVSGGQFFLTTVTADTHENTVTILGLLTLFCAGQFPTNDSTKPTWLK
jgi:hypothetical protein